MTDRTVDLLASAARRQPKERKPQRCKAVSPWGVRCGLYAGHRGHPHTVLAPSGAPWFGEPARERGRR